MQSAPARPSDKNFHLQTLNIQKYSTWLKGKKTGEASLQIDLHFQPFFTQMMCGVMTETGLQRAKVGIMKGFKFKTLPILEELNEIDSSINTLYLKFSEKSHGQAAVAVGSPTENDHQPKNLILRNLRENLSKLGDLLTESSRRVSKSFIYSDIKQLFQIQISFLDLGRLLLQGF